MLRIVRGIALSTIVAVVAVGGVQPMSLAGPPPTDPAPTDAQVAARAVRKMSEATERTCRDIREIVENTVRALRRAAGGDATDAQLTQIGTAAVTRIGTRAQRGLDVVNQIKTAALTAIGDDSQDAISAVNNAATRAANRINECKTNATTRVNRAVQAAVDHDDGDGAPQP